MPLDGWPVGRVQRPFNASKDDIRMLMIILTNSPRDRLRAGAELQSLGRPC